MHPCSPRGPGMKAMSPSAYRPSCRSLWPHGAWRVSRLYRQSARQADREQPRGDSCPSIPRLLIGPVASRYDVSPRRLIRVTSFDCTLVAAGRVSVTSLEVCGEAWLREPAVRTPHRLCTGALAYPHVPTSYNHYTIPLWVNQPQDVGEPTP